MQADVIYAINGTGVPTVEELRSALDTKKPGEPVAPPADVFRKPIKSISWLTQKKMAAFTVHRALSLAATVC